MRMHLANPKQMAIVSPMNPNRLHHNVVAAGSAQAVVRPGAVFHPSLSLLFLLP